MLLFWENELRTKSLSSIPEVNVCFLTGGLENSKQFKKMDSNQEWKNRGEKQIQLINWPAEKVASMSYYSCGGIEQPCKTFELMWSQVWEEQFWKFGYCSTQLEALFILSKWHLYSTWDKILSGIKKLLILKS